MADEMKPGRPRCAGTTRRGAPCRRPALASSSFCRQHTQAGPASGAWLAGLFSEEELRALASLDGEPTVDDVVPVLLVAIRRALESAATPNVVVRACEAYVRAVRERRRLAGQGDEPAGQALDQALDALSGKLGVPL